MGHFKHFGIVTFILVQLCRLSAAQASPNPRNVTVDDNDPRIEYHGAWKKSIFYSLDAGGYHMMTRDPNATATFDFTGVAIYYLSPLWPYGVTTAITLAGDSSFPLRSTVVDLQDHSRSEDEDEGWETVQSAVVWSATNLPNGTYHLQMSVAGSEGWGIVDQLMFTTLEPETTTTTTASNNQPQTSDPPRETQGSGPGQSQSPNTLAIGLGVGLGCGLLLLVLLLAFCYVRSRKRASGKQDGYFPKERTHSETILAGTGSSQPPQSPYFSQSPQSPYFSQSPQSPYFSQSSHQPIFSGLQTPLLTQSDQGQTSSPPARVMDELLPPPSYYESSTGNQTVDQASTSNITTSDAPSASTSQPLATGGKLVLLGPNNLITVSEKQRSR